VGTSKTNISKINKYVKGRLNAQDMHQLERETYDDAFLNEAMEGYEEFAEDDHEETLADLKTQLHRRAAKEKKGQLIIWRSLPIAAIVLVLLGVGYWFLKPWPDKKQYAQVIEKNEVQKPAIEKIERVETPVHQNKQPIVAQNTIAITPKTSPDFNGVLRETEITIDNKPTVIYKTDTIEYIAMDYAIRENAKVDEILKKAEGFEVDLNGGITFNGKNVTKARLNGKDYMGGDVAQAVQSLPADIIERLQVVDDYGDQAGRTGIRSGEPEKVLNLTTLSANNRRQPTYRVMAGLFVPGDTTLTPLPVVGWRSFAEYIRLNAISPDGKTGDVSIAFNVDPQGEISAIRITSGFGVSYGRNTGSQTMNQTAIDIIKNGPKWQGGAVSKEVRLRLSFLPK
jgi:hypothetical protein